MDGFEIDVSDKTAPDYDLNDNIAVNLVDVIRSNMVGNEQEFLALNAGYASGLSPQPSAYLQTIVRGKSGEGKTKLKQEVDSIWPKSWLLRTGSTSDMGLVDDNEWNRVFIGAFAEFQQIQGKMLEMIKSSSGDDSNEDGIGFQHTRNVDDGDDGRTSKTIEKQSMPTVFLFADENDANIPKELETRQMVIRVEADDGINKAVGKTMFDHNEVRVPDKEHEYNYNFDEGTKAVKDHIANIPRPIEHTLDTADETVRKNYAKPTIIPHDESVEWPTNTHPTYDTYGWDAFKVMEPIFNWNKTDSKRAAKAVGNHIRSWARLNYHTRETMVVGDTEYIVAEPQDVGNVLSYRPQLLNLTHGMNEKRLAVIEALTDDENGVGGMGPNGGLQATWMDIAEYIDEYAKIPSLSKSQLRNGRDTGVLDQMADEYLIVVHEGDGPDGAHLYEFLGGNTFGHPNIDAYGELFEAVEDPIHKRPIRETIEQFEEELAATTHISSGDEVADSLAPKRKKSDEDADDTDDTDGGLTDFADTDDGNDVEWDEVDTKVAQRLRETMHDYRIEPSAVGMIQTSHMLGIAPTKTYTDDRGMEYIEAERVCEDDDMVGTMMDTSHHMWGDKSHGQIMDRIDNSISKLRENNMFRFEDEPESDDKYIIVERIDGE